MSEFRKCEKCGPIPELKCDCPHWISVKDRLPEKDCICVVWNETRPFQYYISTYSVCFKEFEVWMIGASRLNDPICFNATHWMLIKLPEN